jgi:hypothetical protein
LAQRESVVGTNGCFGPFRVQRAIAVRIMADGFLSGPAEPETLCAPMLIALTDTGNAAASLHHEARDGDVDCRADSPRQEQPCRGSRAVLVCAR